MKKRKLLAGFLAISAALSLTACDKNNSGDNQDNQNNVGENPAPTEIIVTYDTLGGSNIEAMPTTSKGYAVQPANPKKDGVYFVQWCTDAECTTPFDFGTKLTESITLYAQWRNPYEYACNFYVGDTKVATTTTVEDKTLVKPETNPDHPTNPLYMVFDKWHTEKDESKQNSKTAWDDKSVVTGEVNLYASFKNREATVDITGGSELWNSLPAADSSATLKYQNFDFTTVLGWVEKQKEVCLKTGSDIVINVTEESRLTVRVASGSSNGAKQWVALIKADEFVEGTTNVAEGKGTCMTPTNAKADGIVVKDGKISVVSANSGFSTLIFEALQPGQYVLTAGSSNTFIMDETKDHGTNCIPEIKLSTVKYLSPIEKIEKSLSCPEFHVLAGREADLSTIALNSIDGNGIIESIDVKKAIEEEYLVLDDSAVDYTKAGTYTVGVKYTNPYDEAEYTLEGGITVTVYETEAIKFGEYKLTTIDGEKECAVSTQKVFTSNKISTDNIVVISVAKDDKGNEMEFVLTTEEYDVVSVAEADVVAGANTISAKSGDVTGTYTVYRVDNIYDEDATQVVVNVNPASDVVVNTTDGATFKTISQALDYLKACELDDEVVKVINLAAGTYTEKVEVTLPNVVINGADAEDATKTVITYDAIASTLDPAGKTAHGTNGSAALSVRKSAVGFQANNLTVSNKYNTHALYLESQKFGTDTQAVAALVQADQSVFKNVRFSSYHDTLFAQIGRQYYEDCYIEGRTDYIFGYNATAVFKDCTIHTIGAYTTNENNEKVFNDNGGYVVATKGFRSATETDGIEYGFVFDGCKFEAEEGVKDGSVSLGRSWGANMTLMIMNSEISKAFSTKAYDGSMNHGTRYTKMSSATPNADLLFEYNNTGDGAIEFNDENVEAMVNTVTLIDVEDDDQKKILDAYNNLLVVYGATNGNLKYNSAWAGDKAKDATITIKLVGVYADDLVYEDYSWVGSTVTNYQLNAEAEKVMPEGYEVAAFYSDAECTTVYNEKTVLAADNIIYLKLNNLGEAKTASYLNSNETNEGWTLENQGTKTNSQTGETELATIKLSSVIGEACASTNETTAPSLVPAVLNEDGTTKTPASSLSFNVGSSPSVYLKVAIGYNGTGKSGTVTFIGYDANNNVVAMTTGTTAANKVTNYVTATDGTTKIALKSSGAKIAKIAIVNNDSATLAKGIGVHSVEVTYYEATISDHTYTFDWSKIDTSALTALNYYTDKAMTTVSETPNYDTVKLNNASLSGVNGFLNVIGNATYRDGIKAKDAGLYYKKKDADTEGTLAGNNPECIEVKDDALTVTFVGKGTITITFASTGSKNYSALGLKDAEGAWVAGTTEDATLIAAGVIGKSTEDKKGEEYSAAEYGAYSTSGTSGVTVTFTITEAGTYTISGISTTNGRGARILSLQMVDTY